MCFWNILCDNSISICVINAVNLAKLISKYFFMKKTFLTAFLAFGVMVGASISFGQSNAPTCLKYPDKNQGYFVFNKQYYSSVQFWYIIIQELHIVDNDSLWKNIQEIRTPQNYFRIPQEFMVTNVPTKISIIGRNHSGIIITEDEWIPANEQAQSTYVGRMRCNGPTYNWQVSVFDALDENGNPNGQGVFTFHTGAGSFNDIGVYVPSVRAFNLSQNINWLIDNDNGQISNINSSTHYSYPYWAVPNAPGSQSVGAVNAEAYFQMYNITTGDKIYDEQGNVATGNRHVVYKHLGNWIPQNGSTFSTSFSGTSALSSLSNNPYISGAWLSFLNSNISFNTPLQCFHLPTGTSTPFPPGTVNQNPSTKPAPVEYLVIENNWTKPNLPVFDILQEIHDGHLEIENYVFDTPIPWWPGNEITHILVFAIDAQGNYASNEPIVQMSKHLLVNPDSTLNNFSFSLNPGLYTLKMWKPEAGFVDYYFQVEQTTTQNYPLSNYLDVTIYPVPLSANQNLTVSATTDFGLSYTYTLTDETGNIIMERTVRSGQNEEIRFILDSNTLPSGQLFHKFVFSDGSQIIYNSIKM